MACKLKTPRQRRPLIAMFPGSVSRLAGGLYTSVRRLSESIRDAGVSDVVVVGHKDEFTIEDLGAWQQPQPDLISARSFVGRAIAINRCVDQLRPDIYHYHFLWSYPSVAAFMWRMKKQNAGKLVISSRGMLDPWAIRNSKWKKRLAGRLFEIQNLNSAGCIHALNQQEADAIRSFGCRSPICVIPNGVDIPSVPETYTQEKAKPTLLFLGRIHIKKGLTTLIQAWGAVREQMKGWSLEIAGWDDGGHEIFLRTLVKELNLDDQVQFVGPKSGHAKAKAFSSASAFVLPSLSEGLPMAVLEAWSNGLPVLMTDSCNLSIGFQRQAAFHIEATSESIAAALVKLASTSRDELAAMGQQGRHLVEAEYRWSTAADKMQQVYMWLLGIGPRPDCVLT